MSSYSKVNKRMHREGRYEAFVLHREAIKRLLPKLAPGCKPESLAWRVAVFRYPPKDGSPIEVPKTAQIRSILAGIPFPTTPENDPHNPAEVKTRTDTDKLGLPDAPTYTNRDGTALIHYEQSVHNKERVAALVDVEEAWAKLFAGVDRSKRHKPHDMIMWVFENMEVSPDLIDPADVPSTGVLGFLKNCQSNPSAKTSFYEKMYIKIIPDKRQLEHDAKSRDDGRQVLSKLDAFDAEFESDPDILKMDDVA